MTGPTQTHHDENSWTDLKIADPYTKSKTLAEQAAWDFVKNNRGDHVLELATVNPGLVTGPNLVKCQFSSGDVLKALIEGKIPWIPRMMMPVVDVRDIAQAHLRATIEPAANGKRFLMALPTWLLDMSFWLKEKYPKGYNIKTGEMAYCLIWLASCFSG